MFWLEKKSTTKYATVSAPKKPLFLEKYLICIYNFNF